MKNYIKSLLVIGFLSITSMASAFPADPDPSVDPPAPIDDYLLVLIFLALGFAFWINSKKESKA